MAVAGGFGRRSTVLVAAMAALVAGALGGCTDSDGEKALSRATPVSVPDAPVSGGRVRLGLVGDIVADPADANLASSSDLMVLDLLHDGLTRLDDAGAAVAALAGSWAPDATQRTWTFALEPAATFASGDPVTASDVVASLERIAAGGDTSLAALRLEPVTGFRAFVDGAAEHIAGLTAPDPATVLIVLDSPLSVLPEVLASPVFGVVDAASLTDAEDGDLTELDLSGSWAVAGEDDDRVLLERRADEAGYVDEIELQPFDDQQAAYDAFESSGVDWSTVPADRIGAATERYGADHFAPFHAELFFGMNTTRPNLANATLREAIALAVDREAIAAAVYADLADPLAHVVPVGVPVEDPARAGATFDPERARALVAQAFPGGGVPEIHIDFDESPAQEAMAEIVAENLGAVGIPTSLRPLPLEDYKRFVVSGGQELFSFGWIGVYGSPDAYLAPMFGSSAADNLTRLADADVDAMLATARGSANEATRRNQWAQAEARVLGLSAVVPVAQFRTQVVVADRLQGLAHAVDGTVDWSEVWLTDGA